MPFSLDYMRSIALCYFKDILYIIRNFMQRHLITDTELILIYLFLPLLFLIKKKISNNSQFC